MRLVAGDRLLGDHPDAPVLAMTMRRAFDAELAGRALAAGRRISPGGGRLWNCPRWR
ncbi:MAG: hypothetical protein HZT43_16745 [Exiguobacterium profundum]|nr:MAG: hypothetical protein HZT43_16745 [Exiguobacterium profundum]